MWLTDDSNDKGQLNSGNSRVCSYRGYEVQYSILLSKNLPRNCIFHRELDHYRPCYRMARRLFLREPVPVHANHVIFEELPQS